MQVKIDTREKFHAITIQAQDFAANMTAELDQKLRPLLQNDVKNVVLDLHEIHSIDNAAAEYLVQTQQHFYDNNASFVCCSMRPEVEAQLDADGILELLNCTPTLSEASDIIHMEEIERELMDGPE